MILHDLTSHFRSSLYFSVGELSKVLREHIESQFVALQQRLVLSKEWQLNRTADTRRSFLSAMLFGGSAQYRPTTVRTADSAQHGGKLMPSIFEKIQ